VLGLDCKSFPIDKQVAGFQTDITAQFEAL